jgi:hypothetical protein
MCQELRGESALLQCLLSLVLFSVDIATPWECSRILLPYLSVPARPPQLSLVELPLLLMLWNNFFFP